MTTFRQGFSIGLLAAIPFTVLAEELPDPAEGFLCCNMRTDGKWISDINYAEGGLKVIPAGTPIKALDYGRYRVYVMVDGVKQAIGNDYSRDLDLKTFAQRYIVAQDPGRKLAAYPPEVAKAIKAAQLRVGMTREQVLMAVGYPVSSENPRLDAKIWRFWRSSFNEFQVVFDDNDKAKEIVTDPATRNLLVAE